MTSRKLTTQQQKFTDLVISGLSGTAAYMKAYGMKDEKAASACATRLLKDARVKAQVDSGREKVVEKVGFTLEQHLEKLAELRDAAAKEKQFNAAITAEVSRGKASGFYTDKVEHSASDSIEALIARTWKGKP